MLRSARVLASLHPKRVARAVLVVRRPPPLR